MRLSINMESIDLNVTSNQKRINQRISNDLRDLIINKMRDGLKPKVVADMFEVKAKTVSEIYRTYKKSGSVKNAQQVIDNNFLITIKRNRSVIGSTQTQL